MLLLKVIKGLQHLCIHTSLPVVSRKFHGPSNTSIVLPFLEKLFSDMDGNVRPHSYKNK